MGYTLRGIDTGRTLRYWEIWYCLQVSRKTSIQLPDPEVIKLFSCSTQPIIKFIMLINVKMPTIVGILTFIGMINATDESLKARKVFIFQHFSF